LEALTRPECTEGTLARLRIKADGSEGLPVPSLSCLHDRGAIVSVTGDGAFADIAAEDVLYLDTETTGLSGGAGTLAFLISVGQWREGRFEIELALLDDFCDEPAQMAWLVGRLGGAKAIATYNGRSFDVPLLRSRMIMNGLPTDRLDLPHLDMLPIARSLWREAAGGSARLGAIQRHVLGYERVNDVPGELIPGIFFEWARGIRPGAMGAVLHHNMLDIIALPALVAEAIQLISRPNSPPESAPSATLVGLGRTLQRRQRGEDVLPVLREACQRATAEADRDRCLYLLAEALKREGRAAEALPLWRRVLDGGGDAAPAAAEALAKHLEHHARQWEEAQRTVEAGLEVIERLQRSLAACSAEPAENELVYLPGDPTDWPVADDTSVRVPAPARRPLVGLPRLTIESLARYRQGMEHRRDRLARLLSKKRC